MERRRRSRLDGFDYAARGAYFVTACVARRRPLLGRHTGESVSLTQLGRLVEARLRATPDHDGSIGIDEFIVMPDHLHAIFVLTGDGQTLGQVVGTLKASITRLSGTPGLRERGF